MLTKTIAGAATFIILFAAVAIALAFVSVTFLVIHLGVCVLVAIALAYYIRSLQPTRSLLRSDLRRLAKIIQIDEFFSKNYDGKDVTSYYASTTFRDYKVLAVATGSNAMHSNLIPSRRLPYSCGQLRQMLYVIAQFGDAVNGGKILELGFGKGTNSIYLADLFPSASLTGVDLVEDHVLYAKKWARSLALTNVEFVHDDATSLSTITGPFDVMFGVESFCHLDSDEKMQGFLLFVQRQLRLNGRLVIVDGFRGRAFEQLPEDVQQAMMLAESGFRIRRMASKATWQSLAAAAGLTLVDDADLTAEALAFWTQGWKLAHTLLTLLPWAVRTYIGRSPKHAETGANFVSVATTAYAMALGSAEYGVLVFKRSA